MAANVDLTLNAGEMVDQLKEINASLKEMAAGSKEVEKNSEGITKSTGQQSTKWTELKSKVDLFTGGLSAAKDVALAIYDTAKVLVEEYEKVNNQMQILKSQKVWGDIKIQFDKLEEATGGVVDQLDILESVNKAVSFGIDLSGNKLLDLVKLSGKAALNMGVDLKFAFDSLIVGTARESKMILDNLGVMVDVTKANEDYAKSIGKTAEALTEEESKTALLNNVISELGRTQASINEDMLKTSGTGLAARASRFWRDVKLGAGEGLSGLATYVDEMFMDLAEKGTKHLSAAMSEQKILINEQAAEYVRTLSDIGGVDARLATLLKNETSIYLEHKALIEEIGSRKAKQAEALQIVNENAFMKNGHERSQERQEYILLETLKEKYGEKTKATFELQIAKGKNAFELSKKRGEIEADAEFNLLKFLQDQNKEITTAIENTVAWAANAVNVKDAFEQLWDELQDKGTVNIRGSQSVDDGTIKNMEATEEKTKAVLAKIQNKRVEQKHKDEEKAKQDAIKAAEAAEKEKFRILEDSLDKQTKLNDEKLKREADAFNKQRKQAIDNMVKLADIEIKQDIKNKLDQITRQKEVDDIKSEMASQFFDDKWKAMIDFEEKYGTDLGLSGEEIDKMTKKQFKDRLDEEEAFYEVKNKMQEMSVSAAADFSSMLINDVLLGEKEFRKEMIGDFVKGIGDQMVADGTFHIFAGIAKGWSGNKAGWMQAKAGAAEVGAGIAMGATAKAIGTTSSESESKSKETAAADRNSTKGDQKQKMDVYLYPDEKQWLRSLNKSNNKLGVPRGK